MVNAEFLIFNMDYVVFESEWVCVRECLLRRREDAKNREANLVLFANPSVFAPLWLTHPNHTLHTFIIFN